MKIDIGAIDQTRFHVNFRNIDGLGEFYLIVPHKAMWSWAVGEEHLRSLLCKTDGTVVSAGFPKFFNYTENPQSDAVVNDAFKQQRVVLTEKADGSLIIRSVIDGKVHFRTRGCELIASDMRDIVNECISRYPCLLDPNWGNFVINSAGNKLATTSFLMEFISPETQIVIKYEKPELIALGHIDFSGDTLCFLGVNDSWNDFADIRGLPRAIKRLSLKSDNISSILSAVKGWEGVEGLVTWSSLDDGSTHLCKFKSEWYMRLHALRSIASPKFVSQYCWANDITTLDEMKCNLQSQGFDWEIVSFLEPIFNEYATHRNAILKMKHFFDDTIEVRKLKQQPRKDIALQAKELAASVETEQWFSYIMMTCVNEVSRAKDAVDALILNVSIAQLKNIKQESKARSLKNIENSTMVSD
jgi:hypothetical protein